MLFRKGVFAPLTYSGHLNVNAVAASVYVGDVPAALVHASFGYYRLMSQIIPWSVVEKLHDNRGSLPCTHTGTSCGRLLDLAGEIASKCASEWLLSDDAPSPSQAVWSIKRAKAAAHHLHHT
jgi:hypothetical protein